MEIIQSTFVPTEKGRQCICQKLLPLLIQGTEIQRAARILHQMQISHASSKGAIGLELGDGKAKMEMIDAPMIKQAEQTVRLAKAAGLEVPNVAEVDPV